MRKRRRLIIATSMVLLVVGVVASYQVLWLRKSVGLSAPVTLTMVSSTSISNFTLSATNPINKNFGVHLVAISPDGTTEIIATETGTHLSTKPGQPFASKEFGTQGLVLSSAEPTNQTATFDRWECVTKEVPSPR